MTTPRPAALPSALDLAAWAAITAEVATLSDDGLVRLFADAARTAAGPHTRQEYDAAVACLLAGAEAQQRRAHPGETEQQVRLRASAQSVAILSDALAVRNAPERRAGCPMTGRDHSLGGHWTPVDAVVAAARARGIFLMTWSPDSLSEHREVLITTAPDFVWGIRRHRTDSLGWVAVRVAPDGEDAPGTLRCLAAADASGERILDALHDAESLRTDLRGQAPWVPTRPSDVGC